MTVAVFYNPTSWWTITKPRNYKVSKEYFLFIDSKGNMEAGWFWYHQVGNDFREWWIVKIFAKLFRELQKFLHLW